jgi:DNA polymerase-1
MESGETMGSGLLAIDTETTGVDWHDEAFMISIATPEWSHVYDRRLCEHGELWDEAVETVAAMLYECDKIIMHHAKFDIQKLCRLGIPSSVFTLDKVQDTQALAHLLDEQSPSGLKHLAKTILGEETDEAEVLRKVRRELKVKKEDGYYPIPHEVLAPYAAKDAEYTLRLFEILYPKVEQRGLLDMYRMEMELTMVLLAIEAYGMQVDREYVTEKRREYGDKIFNITRRIKQMAGDEFNPNSPKQILEAFANRGVKLESTDKATLASIDDELAAAIVELRELNKIKSTYLDAMDTESARDGRLHPHFRQHGTRTGRMSSGAAEA